MVVVRVVSTGQLFGYSYGVALFESRYYLPFGLYFLAHSSKFDEVMLNCAKTDATSDLGCSFDRSSCSFH